LSDPERYRAQQGACGAETESRRAEIFYDCEIFETIEKLV
jgi:hypothetical protein